MNQTHKFLSIFLTFNLIIATCCATEEKLIPWVIVVYMAAANDLAPFADRNIEQMKLVGSNSNLVILVHLDISRPGIKKITKRLIIHKGKVVQVGPDMAMDSGSEQTLISTIRWAYTDFPSKYLGVIFWNHGSGDLNPSIGRAINPSKLFVYNPETRMVELDRSIGFIEFLDALHQSEQRGVCFDETTGNYLNDQRLKKGLEVCTQERGRKIDLIYFDACLMAGIGTLWIAHPYADYLIASEEVVLGTGANYHLVLSALAQKELTPAEFARHVVKSYDATYSKITQDYTHSAMNLSVVPVLSNNIDIVANLLMAAIAAQKNNSVRLAIKQARNKFACTHFDEPSYIDLGHLYQNLLKNLSAMSVAQNTLIRDLQHYLTEGLQIIKQTVIDNVTGQHLKNACGISIYFPERAPLHPSYQHTEFVLNHPTWHKFLTLYFSQLHY